MKKKIIILFFSLTSLVSLISAASCGLGPSSCDGDLEILYTDTSDNLLYQDVNGNVNDTGIQAYSAGGIADFDNDGDLDMFFGNTNNELGYIDAFGNVEILAGSQYMMTVGGVADFDNDGDLDVAYIEDVAVDDDHLKYRDNNGNVVDTGDTTNINANEVGGIADFDDDGSLDIVYTDTSDFSINYIDSSLDNTDTGIRADYGVGAVKDFNEDGDTEVIYANTSSNLMYTDSDLNQVDTGYNSEKVGSIADFDDDGDLDAAFAELSGTVEEGPLTLLDSSGVTTDLGVTVTRIGGMNNINPNEAPNTPVVNSPVNNSDNIEVNPTLNVSVSDSDGDSMNVTFYDGSGSVIDSDTNVADGGYATVDWTGLDYGSSYSWYAVASDGTEQTQSQSASFETTYLRSESNEVVPSGSLWIESSDFHWGINGFEYSIVNAPIIDSNSPAHIGSLWIEGQSIHWVDTLGYERAYQGAVFDNNPNVDSGFIWMENDLIHFVDTTGTERVLDGS